MISKVIEAQAKVDYFDRISDDTKVPWIPIKVEEQNLSNSWAIYLNGIQKLTTIIQKC